MRFSSLDFFFFIHLLLAVFVAVVVFRFYRETAITIGSFKHETRKVRKKNKQQKTKTENE